MLFTLILFRKGCHFLLIVCNKFLTSHCTHHCIVYSSGSPGCLQPFVLNLFLFTISCQLDTSYMQLDQYLPLWRSPWQSMYVKSLYTVFYYALTVLEKCLKTVVGYTTFVHFYLGSRYANITYILIISVCYRLLLWMQN